MAEADALLDDDEDVFVLAIGDEARAYPRDWMMIPHIAGDRVGGEDVVMTYCVLTNLPMAFSSDIKTLEPRAGQRMLWRSFKTLYPSGKVFRVDESGLLSWIDAITYKLFVSTLDSHYNGPDPLFPTLRMDDDRLPAKEQIWGLTFGGEQVAFARSWLERSTVTNTAVGGEPVLVAWFPEFETLGVFSRRVDGREVEVGEVDVHGNSPQGRLTRLPQYPHVFWTVWSHWFPDTRVMK